MNVETEWLETVRPALRGLARALFAPVEFVSGTADLVTLSAPNAAHQGKCAEHVADVEQAWQDITGRIVRVAWSDEPTPAPAASRPAAAPAVAMTAHEPDDLDAPDESRPAIAGGQSVLERLAEAFPGAERLEGDGRS
jgi:hypothetical protein